MRMGKPEKIRRGEANPVRADATGKPRHAAAASVVGKLSPDIISTYYSPELISRANEVLERYSEELLQYEQLMSDFHDMKQSAEVDADGTVQNTGAEEPTAPSTPRVHSQYCVDEMQEMLSEASNHFQDKKADWKLGAKAAKFERIMDERYGILRPFLKEHPQAELFVRSMQRKYATGQFSAFRQGKPPIPKSTAVIILFMMQRGNLRWEVTMLAVLFFLVGLQPWALVVVIAGSHQLMEGRRRRPIGPMKDYIEATEPYFPSSVDNLSIKPKDKTNALLQPVGQNLSGKEQIDTSEYDTILLGSGPETLYTAALLSRASRKVLVLSPNADASGCFSVAENPDNSATKIFQNVPFDVESSDVAKISGLQHLLAPALSSTTDFQGGVRFAQVGSAADGHAFEILQVPGMGAEGNGSSTPFIVRASGIHSLMEDAAATLGDGWPGINGEIGNSLTGVYTATCQQINSTSNQFYMSKVLSDGVNGMKSPSNFQETAVRYASAFLDKGFALNPHTRSLMAAIGMKRENIKPSMTSMGAAVSNITAALSGEGMHYPIGGPRALCHAMSTVVEQNGGRIVTGIPMSNLVFEEQHEIPPSSAESADSTINPPRCIGVKMGENWEIKFDVEAQKSNGRNPVVISMLGLITTFIRLLPEDIRVRHKVPRGLPALTERRPLFKIMFGLNGTAEELEITGADFYRVPGAALAQDTIDPVSGQVVHGEIGWRDYETKDDTVDLQVVNDENGSSVPSSETPAQSTRGKRGKQNDPVLSKNKRGVYEPGSSWIHVSFPSAKDPSFESCHGKVTTCVVTIEAADDFVTFFDTKPKMYSSQKRSENNVDYQMLVEKVRKDLLQLFPQLQGKIALSQLIGPLHRGLSHNPERYAAKGIRPESPYPGLFVGGSDLTVGDSLGGAIVGGWLAANAVIGYGPLDYLLLRKTITSDIARFLESPDIPAEEDEAVPFVDRREIV